MDSAVDQDIWADLGIWDNKPRFKHCVLHIGTEKTGSTSLQNFFGVNRQLLLRAGVFVPVSLSPYDLAANHERLTTYALADDKLTDDLRLAAQIRTLDQVPTHRASIARALREEVARFAATRPIEGSTLLLSNEHCQSRLVDVAEVVRLRTLLSEFVQHVKVVVYIRPQHELAVSLYDQALKSGYADISVLPDFSGRTTHWVTRGYFDYDNLLTRWAHVFGRENIDVRIFARSEMIKGSVIDDFMGKLGIDLRDLVFDSNSNVSMSAERQIAMNAINRLSRARGKALAAELRSTLIEQMQQTSYGEGLRPTRSEAEAFYQSFALSNESVRAAFLPHRDTLFSPDFSAYPDTAARLSEADCLAATVLAQQQTINTIKPRPAPPSARKHRAAQP